MTDPSALPLSPEMRALLGLVRWQLAAGNAPDPAPDLAGVAPQALARLAARHALEGLLLRALDEQGAPGQPFLEAARAVAFPAVTGNLRRIAELHRVLEVLASADVPVLALKGPALAVQAYGDVSLRSYGDVDVLVPQHEARRSVQALLGAGYGDRRAQPGRTPGPNLWHDWGFTAPDGKTLVELHWSLTSPRRFPAVDSGEAWLDAGRTDVSIGGAPVPALAPELLLPLLAIHATAHSWGWLEFPTSVAGLVARTGPAMDWDAVLERVVRWRVRRLLSVALFMARDLVGEDGVPVPEPVGRTLLADDVARDAARWFASRLLLEPGSDWHRGSPGLWWQRMRMGDSVADGLRTGWGLLLSATPAEWDAAGGPAGAGGLPGRGTMALRRVRRLFWRYRDRRRR